MPIDSMLTLTMVVCTVLLILGSLIYAYMRLKWRAEDAEQSANDERQLREEAERNLAHYQRQVFALQQRQDASFSTRSTPLDTFPEGLDPILDFADHCLPRDGYLYFLGWEVVDDIPSLVASSLHRDSSIHTTHGLITGRPNSGKQTLAFLILWSLATRHSPQQIRIAWISGKSTPDYLRNLRHNWVEPIVEMGDIPATLYALRVERQQREYQQSQHGVTYWEDLPEQIRPPLLWICLAEFDLVSLALDGPAKLNAWLTVELIAAACVGIRYWIITPTITHRSASWVDQISCFCVGTQDTEHEVYVNTGMSSEELESLGGISPLHFTAPRNFTIRIGRQVATVRTPAIDDPCRASALEGAAQVLDQPLVPPRSILP